MVFISIRVTWNDLQWLALQCLICKLYEPKYVNFALNLWTWYREISTLSSLNINSSTKNEVTYMWQGTTFTPVLHQWFEFWYLAIHVYIFIIIDMLFWRLERTFNPITFFYNNSSDSYSPVLLPSHLENNPLV